MERDGGQQPTCDFTIGDVIPMLKLIVKLLIHPRSTYVVELIDD